MKRLLFYILIALLLIWFIWFLASNHRGNNINDADEQHDHNSRLREVLSTEQL